MVISEQEKKVLLERLALARIAKQAKKEQKEKAAPAAPPAAPAPAPAPVAEPAAPALSVAAPISEPPPVPDLVAASGKKKAKKVSLPDSDSEEEAVLPPKKKPTAKKEQAYMKIKIYREPKNGAALQDLLAAVQEEEEPTGKEEAMVEAEQPAPSAPRDIPKMVRVPTNRPIVQQRVIQNEAYDRREMLRRQALDFFA